MITVNETTITTLVTIVEKVLDAKYDECSIYNLDEELNNLLNVWLTIKLEDTKTFPVPEEAPQGYPNPYAQRAAELEAERTAVPD